MPDDIPIDQVLQLQQQGLSSNQIIQTLQRSGYNPQQIYDALAQAEAQASIGPAEGELPPEGQEGAQEGAQVGEGAEELVERIVQEKWQEVERELSKSIEWRENTNSRLDRLEQSMKDLGSDVDNLHKAIVSKIGEYDKNLLDVGTEIKAMEKVFQKVIPELTSNVKELGRITNVVRGPAKTTRKQVGTDE